MSSTIHPLVHIGLAKSASTFLQNAVFPRIPNIEYLGKNVAEEGLRKAGMMMVRATSLNYREDRVTEAFSTPLSRAAATGYRPVYSEEDLSVFKFLDPETMALRLRKILGPYDVLLISRDPFHWIQSNYQFRLSTYQPRTLWGMNRWLQDHMRVVGIGSDITEINYTAVLDTYARHSGGKVNMIPFELLSKNTEDFGKRLSDVLEVDADIVKAALAQPRDRRMHKGRITRMESDFIREAHRILSLDFHGFLRSLEPYLGLPGAKPDAQALANLTALADAETEDFQVWVEHLQRLRISLSPVFDHNSSPAQEEIRPDLLAHIDRVGRIQKRLSNERYGINLEKLGIRYHGEA